jgi:hypothetical protein
MPNIEPQRTIPTWLKVMIVSRRQKTKLDRVKDHTRCQVSHSAYCLLDATSTLLNVLSPPGRNATHWHRLHGTGHTIQAILSHKERFTTRRYLAAGKGQNHPDSWEPYAMFDDSTAIQQYTSNAGVVQPPSADATTCTDATVSKSQNCCSNGSQPTDRSTLSPSHTTLPRWDLCPTAPVLSGAKGYVVDPLDGRHWKVPSGNTSRLRPNQPTTHSAFSRTPQRWPESSSTTLLWS